MTAACAFGAGVQKPARRPRRSKEDPHGKAHPRSDPFLPAQNSGKAMDSQVIWISAMQMAGSQDCFMTLRMS